MNWHSCYYDHFTAFLGKPIAATEFTHANHDSFPIDIYTFDGSFEGCRSFCTFGLTKYRSALHTTCEVYLPVDDGWEDIPRILANLLDYLVYQRRPIRAGRCISGIENINRGFVETYGKSAMYFATPFGLPDGFNTFCCDEHHGQVYMACFISPQEHTFLVEHGPAQFEALLVEKDVDALHLRRPSCIE